MRALILLAVLVASAACGDDDTAPPLLLIGTDVGPAVLDGTTGVIGAAMPGAVASPDGAVLVSGTPTASGTRIQARDVATRADLWAHDVAGAFQPRTTSASGDLVALAAVPGALEPDTLAPGRSATEIVVLHADGEEERYDVTANIEPEAFSLDGTGLFVVEFLPAERPTHYQVRRLDLETGDLGDVFSVDAELQHAMRGFARTQVWAPDGSRLYTLYTQAVGPETVAFVHVLDLGEQWAHCIGLPEGFTTANSGIALAEGGDELVAADALGGIVAVVDTRELAVARSGELPTPADASWTTVTIGDGEIVVGAGSSVIRFDRVTLAELATLPQPEPVVGVHAGPDDALYLAFPASVVLVESSTGTVLQRTHVDLAGGYSSFTSLGSAATPSYATFECAC